MRHFFKKSFLIFVLISTGTTQIVMADEVSEAEQIFNGAEDKLGEYFSPALLTQTIAGPKWPYFRGPYNTGIYAGINEDGFVYVLGGTFGNSPVRIGTRLEIIAFLNNRTAEIPSEFPEIWHLSRRKFDFFSQMFLVKEEFVVAFADGTYSKNMAAIYGEDGDPPGTGDRQGYWKIENNELLTHFGDPDDSFHSQYFPTYRTRPGSTDLRITGCYSGSEVVFFTFFIFREICFDANGGYQLELTNLNAETTDINIGNYFIDGYKLFLTDSNGEQSRKGFSILAGENSQPSSISIDNERFSTGKSN